MEFSKEKNVTSSVHEIGKENITNYTSRNADIMKRTQKISHMQHMKLNEKEQD